jgi:hypothetical protein
VTIRNKEELDEQKKKEQAELPLSSHLQSESLHHRFFHLREKYEDDLRESGNEKLRPMSQFERHLKGAESEMKDGWSYVPFDMSGDYLQSIPMPGKTDQFITVQPFCQKTLERNF